MTGRSAIGLGIEWRVMVAVNAVWLPREDKGDANDRRCSWRKLRRAWEQPHDQTLIHAQVANLGSLWRERPSFEAGYTKNGRLSHDATICVVRDGPTPTR